MNGTALLLVLAIVGLVLLLKHDRSRQAQIAEHEQACAELRLLQLRHQYDDRQRQRIAERAAAAQDTGEFDSLAEQLEEWPVLPTEPAPEVFPRRRKAA